VRERLDPLIIKRSPLSVPVKKPKATWVRPVIQGEIEYRVEANGWGALAF
jgi:bifunctional non-homologous end joining protein LigD